MGYRKFKANIILLLMLVFSATASAQNSQFSVVNFQLDQFDLTAKNDNYKKVDGNGSLYAIIKVTSNTPNDNISEYRFSFGNMNHEVVQKDNQLWIYVQRNAKFVTISRQGYTTIDKYDLKTTIEAGKTYTLELSSKARSVQTQMVMFKISPNTERPVITVKGTQAGSVEEMLDLDMIDESGAVAKNMPLGSYTYKVMCVGYYPTEGSFTLKNKKETHIEQVTLRARFAETTLTVDADADIYVNGELKGRRTWKGRLNSGNYNVECRQLNYRSSSQQIAVEEGAVSSITLTPPTPITGSVSIISNPLNASVFIDGEPHGTTPQNIDDLLIGQHTITLSKVGYADEKIDVTVTEGEMAEINRRLTKGTATAIQQTVSIAQQNNLIATQRENKNYELAFKYRKQAKALRWIGWGGGIVVAGLGGYLMMSASSENGYSHYDEELRRGLIVAASSIPYTATFLLIAHNRSRKAKKMQNISLLEKGFILNNGSVISASIDVLKDEINRKQTLGLGVQYTF